MYHLNPTNIPTKQPRFGPKVATNEWWIGSVARNPFFRQSRVNLLPPDYSFERNQQRLLQAKHSYSVLAGTRGFPPRAPNEPDWWIYPVGGLYYFDFKIWAWLEASQALGLPICASAEEWFDHNTTYYFKLEAVELLNKFFRPECQKPLGKRNQRAYDLIPAGTPLIQDITLDLPTSLEGSNLSFHLSTLNKTIKDSRYLPVTEQGEIINPKFIKEYLEERLAEFLALGGTTELVQRNNLPVDHDALPDPFYWDLWYHIHHLRDEYRLWLSLQG